MFGLDKLISKAIEIAAPIALNAILPGSGMLLGAAGNLFAGEIGDATCNMIDKLGQEMGAPRFLTDLAKNAVRQATSQFQQPCGNDALDQVKDLAGDKIKNFGDNLFSDFMDCFKNYKKDNEKKCGTGGGKNNSGDSFLVVLAKILGELENKQFAKVTKAAQEVSDLLGTGGDKKQSEQTGTQRQAEFDKMEALKGESQTMTVLAQSVSSSLDGIFKAASTASQRVG